jgi:hypothetical protein
MFDGGEEAEELEEKPLTTCSSHTSYQSEKILL